MILVTGGSGQVARAMGELGGADVRVVGRPAFDLDAPERIGPLLDAERPSVVVNAAAYTAVDQAESDADAAHRANAVGPGLIARWCAARGVPLVHVSTDYVFDGLKGAPYVESDAPSPTGVYGRTKLEGERAVMSAHPGAIVARTSWVYAARGKNFVLTMLAAGRARPELRVVSDQVGCPTSATDLAGVLLALARRSRDREQLDAGVVHVAGTGWCDWHGLAVATLRLAGIGTPIRAIATADWPTAARRPPDSRLDCSRLRDVFGLALPAWEESLRRTVAAALAG